jgi:hypothetical protein
MKRSPLDDRVSAIASQLVVSRRVVLPGVSRSTAYHLAASVLVWHDNAALRPLGNGSPEALQKLRDDSVLVADEIGEMRHSLAAGPRSAALAELRAAGRIDEALATNPKRPAERAQLIYESWLLGRGQALATLTLTELAATAQVCRWLRAAGFTAIPDARDLDQRIDWLTLLEPFEQIAGEHFRGRTDELKQLRAYAGILPPGSRLEATKRALERILSLREKPPLLIHGPGGVGKSTLLGRFILEHARAHEADRFPFAYLNYDRPEVAPGDPLTLLIEAVRQLGIEYPEGRGSCEGLRRNWLARIEEHVPDREHSYLENPAIVALHAPFIRDFASLMGTLGAQDRPLLLILDTFEEVQWRSEEYVSGVWRFLERLQGAVPRLRVVIAGRASIAGHKTHDLPLEGLDQEAATAYLMHRGVADPDAALRLARQLGGSPLTLKLAVDLIEKEGLTGSGKLDLDTKESLFTKMDDGVIQRQLYKRVLGHVHDPEVRKLAHPGLALRRLTPELILEVLAEPCDLAITTTEEAQTLFESMRREVGLVSIAPDGSLRHRADLRKLMVELLHESQPDLAEDIHRGAVRFYTKYGRVADERAEEIYHRMRLGQSAQTIDRRWLDGVEQFLFSAVDEFTGSRRAYLASRLGIEVDEATRKLASLEDWELITERKVRELLGLGDPVRALELIRQRSERSVHSPLVLFEAQILRALGRVEEGSTVLESGIESAVRSGQRQRTLELALAQVDMVWPRAQTDQLKRLLDRLDTLAQRLVPVERLEAVARRVAVSGLLPGTGAGTPDVTELDALLQQVTNSQLRERPTLARWIGAIPQGAQARERLIRIIRVAGVPRSNTSAARGLGNQLATFDYAVSTGLREMPGYFARRYHVPILESLTQTWSEFVLKAQDSRVNEALADLLKGTQPQVADLALAIHHLYSTSLQDDEVSRPTLADTPKEQRSAKGSRASAEDLADLARLLADRFAPDQLREFLASRLNRSLEASTTLRSGIDAVQDVVNQAAEEQWLLELVARAREALPTELRLVDLASRLGLSTLEKQFADSMPAESEEWRKRLAQIEGQVCRLEVGRIAMGTGFLVGADLLLTAYYLLEPLIQGYAAPADVLLRFDYKSDVKGRTVSPGVPFRLASDWLVAYSGHDALGYALVRVDNSPGAQPIGGERAESSAVLRGWLPFGDQPDPRPGDTIIIVHHAEGLPLSVHVETNGVRSMSPDGRHLFYNVNTRPGSGGAPCFNAQLGAVALHQGRSETVELRRGVNFGVLLSVVLGDLETHGLGAHARTMLV